MPLWLLVAALVLLYASPADAAIAERAGTKANCHTALATQVICSTAGSVTSGDLVCARGLTGTTVADTVSETARGITLQRVGNTTGGAKHFHACGRSPSTGTATFQVDLPSADAIAVEVIAFSGTFTDGDVLDVDAGSEVNSTTTTHVHNITTVAASTVILGTITQGDDTSATVAPNNGETESTELVNHDSSGNSIQFEYRVESTAGAKTMQWTSSGVFGYRNNVSSWKETSAAAKRYGVIGSGIGPWID